MIDPFAQPTVYDRITLDDQEIPAVRDLTGGGTRTWTIEDHQSPGYAGAYTVVRQEKLSELTYRFRAWEGPGLAALRAWIDRFRRGQKTRPPKVWKLGDPLVEHNEIRSVVVEEISALIPVQRGLYAYEIKFHEYRRRRPIGGVAVPAKTATDADIEQQEAINRSLQSQLSALEKQAASGEGVGVFSGISSLFGG